MDNIRKELTIGYHPLGNKFGYYIDKVPQHILNELKIEIDKIQNDFDSGVKMNDALAGEIQHEYSLPIGEKVNEYIKNIADKFNNGCNFYRYKEVPLELEKQLWVNFQKKYEYNPMHQHFGVFSFVIWYQIPYYFEDEKKYNYKTSNCDHGHFNFIYAGMDYGDILSVNELKLGIDKSAEGYMALFPSNLYHSVNPFYSSDEYRITVAGNIFAMDNVANYMPPHLEM